MASKSDDITSVLKNLKSRHVEINACMVAKKGLEGVIMFPESFKQDVVEIWEPLEGAIDRLLELVSHSSSYSIEKLYFEMLEYGVYFQVLPGSDTALILFMQCNNEIDLMDFISRNIGDICSARDKILQIIEKN